MLPDTPSSLSLSPRHSHWARGSASGGGVCAPPPASESSSEESCTGNWPCPCPRPRPRPRRLAALSLGSQRAKIQKLVEDYVSFIQKRDA